MVAYTINGKTYSDELAYLLSSDYIENMGVLNENK